MNCNMNITTISNWK